MLHDTRFMNLLWLLFSTPVVSLEITFFSIGFTMGAGGPILVTGGCGFLGFHIVQALLKDPSAGRITVISRNPKTNIFDGVTYTAGDIAAADFVNEVFATVKPEIIFHTAAPRPIDESVTDDAWHGTNVTGTRNMIEAAKNCEATKYFVYTSSVNVIQGTDTFIGNQWTTRSPTGVRKQRRSR
jgi:sterol-4alpha-carboxylate 3-dehydrogenase (decarboxylating)